MSSYSYNEQGHVMSHAAQQIADTPFDKHFSTSHQTANHVSSVI